MQFYYGEQNILRALDEAEFWKHQEAEHAALVPVVAPNLEPQYVAKLEQFGNELNRMQAEAAKYVESIARSKGNVSPELKMQMLNVIKQCLEQSNSFCKLLEDILRNSAAVRANKPAQTTIAHMIRESSYFIGIGQLILS